MQKSLVQGVLLVGLSLITACGDASVGVTVTLPQATVTATTTAPTTSPSTTTTLFPQGTIVGTDPETTTTTTGGDPGTTTTSPVTTLPLGQVEIYVVVAEGRSDAESRISVTQGDRVGLFVTADVADEVHVHGYDVKGDVSPAQRLALSFVADIPGIFEVELEDSGLELFELVVEP